MAAHEGEKSIGKRILRIMSLRPPFLGPSQLPLYGVEFLPTSVAELAQRIVAAHRAGLDLLRRQIWFRIGGHDDPYHRLGCFQNRRGRTQADAAQQRIEWDQFLRVAVVLHHGIDEQSRTFRDEIRIKRLTAY